MCFDNGSRCNHNHSIVCPMKVGDLIRTIEGWSYKTWTGIIIAMEASEEWAQVYWTEANQTDGQVFWAPVRKLELISANSNR